MQQHSVASAEIAIAAMKAFNHNERPLHFTPAPCMIAARTNRPRLAPAIAVVASCLGLFSACGIGARNHYVPPPPPPLAPINLSVQILTFEATPVGSVSLAQQLTLKNTSGQTLFIESIAFFRTDNFSRTTDCGHQLAPGASCSVTITFNPQNEGKLAAQLYLSSRTFQDAKVTLYGTATPRHQPSQ